MPRRVQLIRHTTGAANAFTGLQGEITVDTEAKELRVHDALTPGGVPHARKDMVNVAGATVSVDGKMTTTHVTQLNAATAQAAANLAAIQSNDADIATNVADIATNAANIATNTADIATNAAGIATLDGDLTIAEAKLATIETGATADQTNAEIRAAVEAATDSNVFTDADHSKLNGIEAGATADQSNAEIKTAYEANANTNAYTDAEKAKVGYLSVTQAVNLDVMESNIVTNNAKVSNATHTGQVTGATALALAAAAITAQTDIGANIVDADEFLISDGGALRRSDISRLATYIQGKGAGFASGTTMLFYSNSAPAGWTKVTTAALNNNALRVVTTTAWTTGSKGSVDFTTVFGKTATDAHTLTTAQIPAHDHGSVGDHGHPFMATPASESSASVHTTGGFPLKLAGTSYPAFTGTPTTTAGQQIGGSGSHTHASVGSGNSHSHNIDIRVKYVDFILATKS